VKNDPDVLVAGGSIAGCITALSFARNGLRVEIVEKARLPDNYKRLCTHFIQPSALPVLKELELDRMIEEAGGLRNKADIWTSAGWIRSNRPYTEDPGTAYGYNIERRILDPLLRKVVAAHPLIHFRSGFELHKIKWVDENPDRVRGFIFLDNHKNQLELEAKLLVAADGRYSKMAALLLNKEEIQPNMRFACFAYFENVPLHSGNHSQFWMIDSNMAFAYPLAHNRTLICLFILNSEWPEWKNNLDHKYLSFIKNLTDAPPVDGGQRVSAIYKALDIPNIFRQPVYKGVAFIGDAAMALDPMSGVGCGFAIQTGSWLANITAAAIKGNGALNDALQQYATYHSRQLLPHATGICADSLAKPLNESRHALLQEVVNDAYLTDAFLALTGRIITPGDFQSRYLKRMLQRKMNPENIN
jgi:2-polyprenyl-6-methoxyphenol hydroxylase-like FAD-dependent oxidoreductase